MKANEKKKLRFRKGGVESVELDEFKNGVFVLIWGYEDFGYCMIAANSAADREKLDSEVPYAYLFVLSSDGKVTKIESGPKKFLVKNTVSFAHVINCMKLFWKERHLCHKV